MMDFHCLSKDVNLYFNLSAKWNGLRLQLNYLRHCRDQGTIPLNIAATYHFKLSFDDATVEQRCHSIHSAAASRVLDTLISIYKSNTESLRQQVFSTKKSLSKMHSSPMMCEIEILRAIKLSRKSVELQEVHSRKLIRDKTADHPLSYIADAAAFLPLPRKKTNRRPSIRKKRSRPTKTSSQRPRALIRRSAEEPSLSENLSIALSQAPSLLPAASPAPLTLPNMAVLPPPPAVINLTDKDLSPAMIRLFSRGPNFIPTPFQVNLVELLADIDKWKNNLRWAYHFTYVNPGLLLVSKSSIAERKLVRSGATAPKAPNPALELFISNVEDDVRRSSDRPTPGDNLPIEERHALKELLSWKDVEIRPYDKGRGFVLDTKENYKVRMLQVLQDPISYSTLQQTPSEATERIVSLIQSWADKWQREGEISEKIKKWIISPDAKPGSIFQNYKAHKPPDFPPRTISSGCGGPTERIAQWIEVELSRHLHQLTYRIQDTSHLIRKLEDLKSCDTFPSDVQVLHVSWDIEAMYPNIDTVRGLQACREYLEERDSRISFAQDTLLPVDKECILEALDLCLRNNICLFEEVVYLQCKGTAMGPSMACSYADIARHYLIDKKVMSPQNPLRQLIPLWAGYRDDIYVPFLGSQEELQELHTFINSIDPDLKFKMNPTEPSTIGVEYLDLFIYSNSANIIHTMIYSKACDPHAYLLPTSCHPLHCCQNIPKSVLMRVKRNCSEDSVFLHKLHSYIGFLEQRGYSNHVIASALSEVHQMSREQLLHPSRTSKPRIFPLIMRFNPKLPNLSAIVRRHLPALDMHPNTRSIFSNNVFVSYRTEKNLKDLLTSSRFRMSGGVEDNSDPPPDDPPPDDPSPDVHPQDGHPPAGSPVNQPRDDDDDDNNGSVLCGKKCKLCQNFVKVTSKASSFSTSTQFTIKGPITCTSPNVIYMIKDKICKVDYIGSTRDMRARWANHKSHIKKFIKSCEIATHFNDPRLRSVHSLDRSSIKSFDKDFKDQVEVVFIESMKADPLWDNITLAKKLEAREHFWQCQLKVTARYGGLCKRTVWK